MRKPPAPMEVAMAVEFLLTAGGRDPNAVDLVDTPRRFLSAYTELMSGASVDVASLFTTFEATCDEMVMVRDVPFVSICEHHLLPFIGKAHVAYIPRGRIIGLSKVARVVDAYCRRPQVQERATQQIAEAFMTHLQPLGVGVVLAADHTCMSIRGVRATGARTVTSAMLGVFRDGPVRAEFMSLVHNGG